MIESIKKLKNNRFLINDCVIIHNFDFEKNGISYSLDYDESEITHETALEVAESFIREAYDYSLSKNNQQDSGD